MTFYLQHNKEGRVFIDKREHASHTTIRAIDAVSWGDARDKISDYEFDKVEGYGWFLPKGG